MERIEANSRIETRMYGMIKLLGISIENLIDWRIFNFKFKHNPKDCVDLKGRSQSFVHFVRLQFPLEKHRSNKAFS